MLTRNTHSCILLLGSNLFQKKNNIFKAKRMIQKQVGGIIKQGVMKETIPEEFDSKHNFINQFILVCTKHSPKELLSLTQQIEKKIGRETKTKHKTYTDRIIDIDIITYDNLLIETKDLMIPHPQIKTRKQIKELYQQFIN